MSPLAVMETRITIPMTTLAVSAGLKVGEIMTIAEIATAEVRMIAETATTEIRMIAEIANAEIRMVAETGTVETETIEEIVINVIAEITEILTIAEIVVNVIVGITETLTIAEIVTNVIVEITGTAGSGMVDETKVEKTALTERDTLPIAEIVAMTETEVGIAATAETAMETTQMTLTVMDAAEAEMVIHPADQAETWTVGMTMTVVDPVDETVAAAMAAEEAHLLPVPTHQAVMERTLTPRAATLATDDVEGAVVCILTPDNSSRH